MLELILDQDYKWDGVPADRSPYHNHGKTFNTSGAADGIEPGSGVITFPKPDSRVRIASSYAWNRLISLKIDIIAKLDPMARRTISLVEGDKSFQFGISEGALEASFENGTGNNRYIRAADTFSPDHNYHPIPANKWIKLGFYHDGFAKMRLFYDDELVAQTLIEGSIPPVQNFGVSVGNSLTADNRQFPGEIDRVQIWRLDPKTIKREFLGRPLNSKAAQCWQKLIETIVDSVRKDPENQRVAAHKMKTMNYNFIRSLYLLPDSDQAKLRFILTKFVKLWNSGNVDGVEMNQVLCDWIRTLGAYGIDPSKDPLYKEFESYLQSLHIDTCAVKECDPIIVNFFDLLRTARNSCHLNKGEVL